MRKQTENRPFFFRQVVVDFVFSDPYFGHISRTKKWGRLFTLLSVCWLVHDQRRVEQSHPNT